MRFTTFTALLSTAVLGAVADNTVTFVSQDATDRTIHFTGNAGMPTIEDVKVPGHKNVTVDIPHGWVGNWFSVSEGEPVVPGMLGEVAFNSWGGITFFDVSAIVNPHDHVGVKKLFPVSQRKPTSGCDLFPCAFAYYLPDDVQTQATDETDLICTLGGDGAEDAGGVGAVEQRDEQKKVYPREFVLGRGSPAKI